MSAQAGVGLFVSPSMAECVVDWVPQGGRVCLIKFMLQERPLCVLQVYAPNMKSQYEAFLEEIEVALGKATSSESLARFAISMHMWASTMPSRKVLLGNMVTLTSTRTEGAYCSFVPPVDCA